MLQRAILGFVLLALTGAIFGCGEEPAPGPLTMDAAETERWEIALVEWRIEKNESFMQAVDSPLPERLREGFEGLDYYFPEASLRFRVPLVRAAAADTVHLAKAKGEGVPYMVRGTVRFRAGQQDCELTIYGSSDPGADDLWLPFYDKTNGESTYAGGRYLDLVAAADGTVELDFNKAYNPYCAYDAERWCCVLPPAGNTLPVRVEAGEKLLAGADH